MRDDDRRRNEAAASSSSEHVLSVQRLHCGRHLSEWAHELPAHAASLSDAELEEQARCLGAPFDGIGFAVAPAPGQLEDLATRCDAPGAGQGPQGAEEGSGELVLWGAQVGGPDRWAKADGGVANADGSGGDGTPSGECRFHTGDLVRRRGDELYYLGRSDQQVKLNGRRHPSRRGNG